MRDDMSVAMDFLKQKGVKNEPERLWVTKLTLRCISSVLSCAIIGTGASTHNVEIALMMPPAFIILWNVAEGITLIVRRRAYEGIHPGACVALDLLLSLGNLVCVGMTGPEISNPNIYSSRNWHDPVDYSSQRLIIGGVAVSIIVTLIQISLFVIACVETHRRRKAERNVPIALATFDSGQQQGTFINPNQQPFNPNQPPGAFNPNQQQQTQTQTDDPPPPYQLLPSTDANTPNTVPPILHRAASDSTIPPGDFGALARNGGTDAASVAGEFDATETS
ncbi:hypothetical protein VE01_10186 [Pseudogymnoascus verrucosus]|uniref:Uncharacterized protein n=1 Tax=Pseudogymnoascus verrucosus TaxID=342668 RepID=A0A1B8G7P7_9PEZI|nr:uncharacterized protein VE01_10186 [Pseudogymnoascus verrucosus]OBT91844.2 hypothetical protein VE01_10186 [Pseudogymnoascus verrucosus]